MTTVVVLYLAQLSGRGRDRAVRPTFGRPRLMIRRRSCRRVRSGGSEPATAPAAVPDGSVEDDVSTCRACGNELVEIALTIDGSHLIDARRARSATPAAGTVTASRSQLDGVLHDISAVPTRYRRSLSS